MKTKTRTKILTQASCLFAVLALASLLPRLADGADVVYVTSLVSNCTAGLECREMNPELNPNTYAPVYSSAYGLFTSAISSADGKPITAGAQYFSFNFTNSTHDPFAPGVVINPALNVPGGTYAIYHVFSAAAGNVSANLVLGVTNISEDATLSFTSTDKFRAQFGNNTWQLLGYLTNNPGSSNPMLNFYYLEGTVNAGSQQRLIVDTFRFFEVDPCINVPAIRVTGPLATNVSTVAVTGVSEMANRVSVYQNSGSGMTLIATTNVSSPAATVYVPVSGLARGAQVAATQTINNQEGCTPTSGTFVGGGANPSIRVVFNIRANPELTGPVGAPGSGSTIYFLGAETISGTAPVEGAILMPSTNWQTVTFTRGEAGMPIDPAVAWTGTAAFEDAFGAFDGVAIASEGDPGPFEIYLDDLANGTHGIVQGWEGAEAGTLSYQFQAPSYSGTTSGNLLSAPNESVVTSEVAATGSNSLRVRFQFSDSATTRWLRLVTAAVAGGTPNPQLDLNEPISIKILLPPPGFSVAVPHPGSISLEYDQESGQLILNWTGNFQLQSAASADGPYTDVAGVTQGPYTVTIGTQSQFYRLRR